MKKSVLGRGSASEVRQSASGFNGVLPDTKESIGVRNVFSSADEAGASPGWSSTSVGRLVDGQCRLFVCTMMNERWGRSVLQIWWSPSSSTLVKG